MGLASAAANSSRVGFSTDVGLIGWNAICLNIHNHRFHISHYRNTAHMQVPNFQLQTAHFHVQYYRTLARYQDVPGNNITLVSAFVRRYPGRGCITGIFRATTGASDLRWVRSGCGPPAFLRPHARTLTPLPVSPNAGKDTEQCIFDPIGVDRNDSLLFALSKSIQLHHLI